MPTGLPGVVLVIAAFLELRFRLALRVLRLRNTRTVINARYSVAYVMLLAGVSLSFLCSAHLGLIAFGAFFVMYRGSFTPLSSAIRCVPILCNPLTKFAGLVILSVGLLLAFLSSVHTGIASLAVLLVSLILVRGLALLEARSMERRF